MENWLKKNLKYIAFALLFLLVMKNAQSCNRKMSIRVTQKNHIAVVDSLNTTIDSLKSEIVDKNYHIKETERAGSERLAEALSQTSGQSSVNIESLLRQLDRATQETRQMQGIINKQKLEISGLNDSLKIYRNR